MNTTWKSRLGKLETLIKGTGRKAFEIATELRALSLDKDFLAEACEGKPDKADDLLAKYADAAGGLRLNELIQVLEHFPNEKDWKDGHIRNLLDKTIKLIAESAKRRKSSTGDSSVTGASESVEKLTRRHVTIAEYEELERKYKQSQAEIRRLRSEYEKLLDKIPQLAKMK